MIFSRLAGRRTGIFAKSHVGWILPTGSTESNKPENTSTRVGMRLPVFTLTELSSRIRLSQQRYSDCNHPTSIATLNPCQNAFSQTLFEHGFNFFRMLTVDLLHEFELGLWKDFFTHLVRILEFLGAGTVQTFNERCIARSSCDRILVSYSPISFRQVPMFGETTIRRFDDNVCDMKRLAGHDFEDILQVSSHIDHCRITVNF